MAEHIPDDEARDRRLAAIRARRGTPERLAEIEILQASKVHTAPSKTSPPAAGKRLPARDSARDSQVVAEMRQAALESIRAIAGRNATRVDGQTYRVDGKQFHLRTRQRDEQTGGWIRYWFGIRDHLWQPDHFFVLVCHFDFVLVVPVSEWVPHMDRFSISNSGTPEQARQPHIYWRGSSYELREASRGVSLKLDVRPWVNNFSLLTQGG